MASLEIMQKSGQISRTKYTKETEQEIDKRK